MVTRSVPAKRKQTADMAESPPKRVTRARKTKASEPQEPELKAVEEKPKVSRSRAAAKPASSSKSTKSTTKTTAARATKRKAAPEPALDVEPAEDIDPETAVEPEPEVQKTATRTRQKKTVVEEKAPAPKKATTKRTRGQTDTVEAAPEPPVTKTRGKTRKAATSEVAAVDAHEKEMEIAKAQGTSEPEAETGKKKVTRTRAAAKTSRTTASTRSTATRKKVQFQDEHDKENIPVDIAATTKSASKATGMRAKPTRKAPTTRATRGRRAAAQPDSEETALQKSNVLPLSPKKVCQVAKTPSSSEDELAGPKSPLKMLTMSPHKSPGKGLLFSPKKIESSSPNKQAVRTSATSSPTIVRHASVLQSPAKRPPLSPFKDGLKSPAKKLDLGATPGKSIFDASKTVSPLKASLLQASPKKAKLVGLAPKTEAVAQSPLKASLLQSPAKRPFASPSKSVNASSRQAPPESQTSGFTESTIQEKVRPQDIWKGATDKMSPPQANDSPEKIDSIAESTSQAPDTTIATITDVALDSAIEEQTVSEDDTVVKAASAVDETKQPFMLGLHQPQSFAFNSDYRRISLESQLSEDELSSPDKRFAPTPLRKSGDRANEHNTPVDGGAEITLTSLADQLTGWTASTPGAQGRSRQQRGIFSLGPNIVPVKPNAAPTEADDDGGPKSSFFEDDMAILDAQELTPDRPSLVLEASGDMLGVSMSSAASQEYGDENAVPIEAEALRAEQGGDDHTMTCTPAKVFTPAAKISQVPREAYTVSKVPLRPAGDDSPFKLPRQRSKSLGGALAVLVDSTQEDGRATDVPETPAGAFTANASTPKSGLGTTSETPGRAIGQRGSPTVLRGAVVFVDVHTSEGADASGIFVDLLTQMGARCVKTWNWNPGHSLDGPSDQSLSPQGRSPMATPAASKVGITHVVYKDGGVRTLEKVRLAGGLVSCVGVGWVLE